MNKIEDKKIGEIKKIKITIRPENKIIWAEKGENLALVLKRKGIKLSTWCNLKGICGRCLVKIIKGKVGIRKEKEIELKKRNNWPNDYRLACQLNLIGDMEIIVPEKSILKEIKILNETLIVKRENKPIIKKYTLKIKKVGLIKNNSLLDYIKKRLNLKKARTEINALKEINQFDYENKNLYVYVYDNNEIIRIKEKSFHPDVLGLAIDLGTTTIVLEAINLESGEIMAAETDFNHQIRFGADVLSRIAYACSGRKKLKELQKTIINDLNSLIKRLSDKLKIKNEYFLEAVIAGNTAMNHLLLGLPVDSLGRAPFVSLFSSLWPIRAGDINLKINPSARIFIAPNIHSFIGGDISAGLLAANIFKSEGPSAFIDLGTNGEIIIKKDDRLVAASTAAGPAFEGGNLSCGLPAVPGAISRAEFINGKIKIETINNFPARGICGSGLIDLLAGFIHQGVIRVDGRIVGEKKKILIKKNIALTQEDIRQAQLACAAIKTGFRLLLDSLGLKAQDLKAIYLAGAFGQELSIKNSQFLGLLPSIEVKKIIFLGNSSLAGARLLLLNNPSRPLLFSLIKKIDYIPLATKKDFQKYFLQTLRFEPWS